MTGAGELDPVLDRVLDRADDVLGEAAARERSAGLDPRVEAALAAVTGPDAPLALRSVAGRVRRGHLSWEAVWSDPHALGPEEVRVVQEALVVLARCLAAEATPA